MYEIGRVYIWQNQVGEFAPLNGTECTIMSPGRWQTDINGRHYFGWDTDAPDPHGKDYIIAAEAGDLRPRGTPSGERKVMQMFLRASIGHRAPEHPNCRFVAIPVTRP